MKPSMWNVLKLGVGGVLSLLLLVACADGRGSNGFKSYQYTKDEMAVNKAKLDAKAGVKSNIPVNNGPVVDPSQTGGGNNGGGAGAGASGHNNGDGAGVGGKNQQQGALPPEALDTLEYQKAQDAAQSKVLADNQQEALQVSVDQLRKSNELAVKGSKEVPQLKQLVKGITVTSTLNDKQLLLNIDALVLIEGADHTVSVLNSPISYLKDGVTTALPFQLKKGTERVVPGKKLIITALCKDTNCSEIQIRFMFENRAGIVVGYKQVEQGVWALQESNIGEVPDLKGGQNVGQSIDLEQKAREAAEARARGGELTEEQKAALAVQTAQEAAQAAQAEEAAKLAAEKEAQEKQASETAAAQALGYQFEGAFERGAIQKPWEAKEMSPASGESTEQEQPDPFFTPL